MKSDWELIKVSGVVKKPEYYIVATNVKLSGADGRTSKGKKRVGGWTKVESWLKGLVDAGDIRGFDIWSGDKIADLLASHPAIAQNFAAWTTPGDVLTQLLQSVQAQTPSFPEVIRRAMKTELRRDQFARLKDAGSVDNDDIPTSHVFVDLPVQRSRQDEVSDNALQSIVELSRGTFRDDKLESKSSAEPDPNKIVLMGGPGQGKSTLTTFLVQFFRAKILTEMRGDNDPTVKYIIPEILRRAKSEGVKDIGLSRYPVWVSLPKFADAVAAARASSDVMPSLLAYVATSFALTADQEVKREDLRTWLRTYPWIVILDGLDEVPSSGERPAVLEAIKSFETEVAEADGDVVLVVTTRPQGYNHDLNPKEWRHWQLQALTPEQALRYAEELGKALHRDDQSRRNDVLVALREASLKPSTSRLMTNPLQVTILHMIVDTGGGVPPGRWNLFNGYYEVLKRREKAKGGEIRRAIERNWNWLGPIHQRVGLALHVESEVSGGANAFLTPDEFRALVREYLSSETLSADDSEARADELQRLAVDRLVLLTAKEQGRIAFDVRSLQEFMAAAALTSTGPLTIEPRLRSIASASHWRNVFLIAASRCFDEDAFHWIRGSIIGIPRAIEGNLIQLYLRRGARLALDMFHDGLALEHPDFRRQLATHALDILSLGPREYDARLSRLYEPATESVVMDIMSGGALGKGSSQMSSAWMMAVDLCRTVPSLRKKVEQSVPAGESLTDVLTRLEPPLPTRELGERIRAALLYCDPFDAMSSIQMYLRREGAGKDENSSMLRDLTWRQAVVGKSIRIFDEGAVAFHYNSVNLELPHVECADDSRWCVLNKLAELTGSITARATAQFLREVYSRRENFDVLQMYRGYMPWPLATILSSIDDISEVQQIADEVEAGHFGDVAEWLAAEDRWSQDGLQDSDLELAARSGRFFGRDVAELGMPQFTYLTKVFNGEVKEALAKLVKNGRLSRHLKFKRAVASAVCTLFDEIDHDDYDKDLILELIELSSEAQAMLPAYFFYFLPIEYWNDDPLTDRLCALAVRSSWHFHPALSVASLDAMLDAYERHPARRGGIIKLIYNGLHHRFDNGQFRRLKRVNLAPYADDDVEILRQKSIIKALFQDEYDSADFVEAVTSTGGEPPFASSYLLRDDVLPARSAALAELIIDRLRQDDRSEDGVSRPVLNRVLDRLPSEIHDPEKWSHLQLPAEVERMVQGKQRRGAPNPAISGPVISS